MRKLAKDINQALESSWDQYMGVVDRLAEQAFNEVILPYMQRHGYCFLPGNGAYYIGKYTPGRGYHYAPGYVSDWTPIDDDELPQYIQELIQMEIPGDRGNSLGTIMPDYRPPKDK